MPEFVAPAFVKIRTGLLDKKHVQKMGGGSPLVLYLYLQARVRFRGDSAGVTVEPYTHEQAAEDLGLRVNSVKVWFQALRKEGYITTRQLRRGLEVTITKYGETPLKGDAHVSPTGTETGTKGDAHVSPTELRVIRGHPKGDTRTTKGDIDISPTYKDARATRESRDTRDTPNGVSGASAARPLTPLQQVVNAWLEALDRDPTKAKDYGRWAPIGSEIAERGHTPQDVRNCTRYLLTDPWRRERRRVPTLADVRDALPTWIEDGRPSRMRPVVNGQAEKVRAGISAVAHAIRQDWQEEHNGPRTDWGRGAMGGGGTVARLSG